LFFKGGEAHFKTLIAFNELIHISLRSVTKSTKSKTLNFFTPMGKAIVINDANFDEIINSDKPVLVDFWAEWCGPCKMIGPVVEELAGDYEGKAVVGKLNVDENPSVTARFGVRSIPTLLVFKGGQIVDKQIGAVPKSVLAQKLQAQVA
jgi:thioredoxin 1